MLTQKIIGTEYKKVKYHGTVKFLIFECNNCGRNFSKMESYSKKQLKIHKNACCFCSPDCRNYFFNKRLMERLESQGAAKHDVPQAPAPTVSVTQETPQGKEKDGSFFGWLNRLLEN